jgi:hypothetical protein
VKNDTEAYAAFDSSKLRHAVAIAVGKRPTLVVTAIAREPSGFVWALKRSLTPTAAPIM